MGRASQLCGASVIVYKDDQILLQQRRDNQCWGYHGGRIEIGETVAEAARREVFEETGLTIGKMELFGVFSGPEQHFVYPDGNEVYIIDIVFVSDDFSGEPRKQDAEVLDLQWFGSDRIPDRLSPPIKGPLLQFVAAHFPGGSTNGS